MKLYMQSHFLYQINEEEKMGDKGQKDKDKKQRQESKKKKDSAKKAKEKQEDNQKDAS